VLSSDLEKEINRTDTRMLDAKGLTWCGNDLPILSYPDRIVLVGPNSYEPLDLRSKTGGIKCFTEIDGLRVVTSEKTYFLEKVSDATTRTFKIASTTPAAKLLNALKSVDLNIPRADEIIREVGPNLNTGIEVLLEVA
jgi:hypothetical protein